MKEYDTLVCDATTVNVVAGTRHHNDIELHIWCSNDSGETAHNCEFHLDRAQARWLRDAFDRAVKLSKMAD